MKRNQALLVGLGVFLACAAASAGYDYPITNAYESTVLGTPPAYRAPLPSKIRSKDYKIEVFEDREIPRIFWYDKKLRFSLARQRDEAPLVFVIAGTGASHDSAKMRLLERALYGAGFHVISLTSPTHPNFIVSASTSGVSGYIVDDAKDLYRVMQLAWDKVKKKVDVTEFLVTGYSLGGAQAAFLSQLDEERGVFGFSKVLMINPPVSLYHSAEILDKTLADNIPPGPGGFYQFYERMMGEVAEIYKGTSDVEFNEDLIYTLYEKHPQEEGVLAALIGLAFRMSSSNMVFTSDVVTDSGYIVPKGRRLKTSDSVTDYFKVCSRTSFLDYVDDLVVPVLHARDASLDKEALIGNASLRGIEDYLRDCEKIGVVTNEDDIILAPGDVDFFRETFGERAKIFPIGGHCGNMAEKEFLGYVVDFMKD